MVLSLAPRRSRRPTARRRGPRSTTRAPFGNLALVVDEDRAAGLEVAYDVRVVDDLLANVDGRPVQVEQLLDRVDGALDPGAIAARRRQEDPLHHEPV